MEDAKRTDAPPERLNMPVTFDPASFKEHAKLCTWFEGLYNSTAAIADNKCFRLDYVNVNDPATLDAALAFVGSTSTHKDLESQREKQFQGKVRDGFANWKELTAFARKNGHGDWVDAAEKI
jgi:hypothetical protein